MIRAGGHPPRETPTITLGLKFFSRILFARFKSASYICSHEGISNSSFELKLFFSPIEAKIVEWRSDLSLAALACKRSLLCAHDFWAHEFGAVGTFSSGKRSNVGITHGL